MECCTKCSAQAAVQCACQLRPIPLCTACVGSHLATDPGNHSITMISKMSNHPGNDICDDCEREPAESVCSCLQPLRKYCLTCKLLHINKNPHFTHSLLPIQVLKKPLNPIEFSEISEMVRRTNNAKQKLMSNFTLMETCREEIIRKSNELIEEIQMWQTETLSEIDVIRNKAHQYIGNICSELEKSMFDLAFLSENGFVNMIRSGSGNESLVFFQYTISLEKLKPTLKSSISMKYSDGNNEHFLEIGFLPLLKGDSLVKFQFPSCVRTQSKIGNTGASKSTAFLFKDVETLFGIGGEGSSSVFSLHIPSNAINKTYPKMSAVRRFPGVVFVTNSLLVFGGHNGNNYWQSCEKLDLSETKWKPIGNMHEARFGFNPVQRGSLIYIIGGCQVGSIETYNLQSSVFTRLECMLSESSLTCSFRMREEIVILDGSSQYSLSPLDQLQQISDTQTRLNRWSNIQPIRYQQYIYYVRSDINGPHELLRWNIQSRNEEKMGDIQY